jgi:hypothetical protein
MGTKTTLVMQPHRYGRALRDAKGKAAFSSNSKLMPAQYWNESKKRCCGTSNPGRFAGDFSASIAASAIAAAAVSAGTIAGAAGTLPRRTVAGATRTIRGRVAAGEPGKQVRALAARADDRTVAQIIAAGALPPKLAIFPALHHQIIDQRRAADCYCESRHYICHRVFFPGIKTPPSAEASWFVALEGRAFIDHSSEMWNLYRDAVNTCRPEKG